MNVTQITVGAFQENCYLVEDPKITSVRLVTNPRVFERPATEWSFTRLVV